MSSQDDIVALNKRIDSAIAEGQQAVGRKNEIEERLKKDYDISDPSEIPATLRRLEEERDALQARVDSGLKRLREKYGW